jgi:hypothetical protein
MRRRDIQSGTFKRPVDSAVFAPAATIRDLRRARFAAARDPICVIAATARPGIAPAEFQTGHGSASPRVFAMAAAWHAGRQR